MTEKLFVYNGTGHRNGAVHNFTGIDFAPSLEVAKLRIIEHVAERCPPSQGWTVETSPYCKEVSADLIRRASALFPDPPCDTEVLALRSKVAALEKAAVNLSASAVAEMKPRVDAPPPAERVDYFRRKWNKDPDGQAMGLLCNAEPDRSLPPEYATDWAASRAAWLDAYHKAPFRTAPPVAPSAPADTGGVALIAEERQRQITAEGWTPEHDDKHSGEEMAMAAACYATPCKFRGGIRREGYPEGVYVPEGWPWGWEWWKPGKPAHSGYALYIPRTPEGRLKELVKAGALIAAEIDRLQRLGHRQEGP